MAKKFKFPYELIIAISVNILLLIIVFNLPGYPKIRPQRSVELDITDYTVPKPKIIPKYKPKLTTESNTPDASGRTGAGQEKSMDQLAESAKREFTPVDMKNIIKPGQSISQKRAELKGIQNDLNFLKGLGNIKGSGKGGIGGLPAGHKIGKSFQARLDASGRRKSLRKYGGDSKTESAVDKALKYLAGVQNKDGSWGGKESFTSGDAAALSALATLTFLAHGENCNSKQYGQTVKKATEFLSELANTTNIEYAGEGFGHAIITYALAEAYALNGSLSLERVLKQRLYVIVQRQNKFGSFNVGYDNSPQAAPMTEDQDKPVNKEIIVGEPACDLSLLGWHIQAMTAAKNSGIKLDGMDKALKLATEALIKIHQAKRGGFSQGINMKRFDSDPNMDPVGLLGMQLLGLSRSSPARRAENILEKTKAPCWKRGGAKFPLYRWYYQTQALFQSEQGRGRYWERWNENLKKELTSGQQSDGSWSPPGGDRSFRVKNKQDLAIYSTSLCALMLQVYYRYLPSYSITEASDLKSEYADKLDLGLQGLITRLPGGADPMAAVILGIGPVDMKPIHFGKFNNHPGKVDDPLVKEEFERYASFSSTIPVRAVKDWPQTLQPNQRIAVFFDEVLPENFKGHLLLTAALITNKEDAATVNKSIEVVINGKRLYNSLLPRHKTLVNILIPANRLQSFGNVLQIRNNGKGVIAFDGAKLAAITNVGGKLYLAAENIEELPWNAQSCFNAAMIPVNGKTRLATIRKKFTKARIARAEPIFSIDDITVKNFQVLLKEYESKVKRWEFVTRDQKLREQLIAELKKVNPEANIIDSVSLSAYSEYRQALPTLSERGNYTPDEQYWGSWHCFGSERMGNEFQLHYLRGAGRQIIDWISGGGSGVTLKSIYDGGKFYDKVFKTELPALSALTQTAKLFEGSPRQLPVSIYPRYGEKPLFATNAAAAYNASGVATIVIAKRFPLPEETELTALVPWNGSTTMIIEKGFLPDDSPYRGFATGIEQSIKKIDINGNVFKFSAVLPELTVIRLVRHGSRNFVKRGMLYNQVVPRTKFDYNAVRVYDPKEKLTKNKDLKHHNLRTSGAFASTFGRDGSFQLIPSTQGEKYKPKDDKSIEVSFKQDKSNKRHDSVYLSLGKAPESSKVFYFDVMARVHSSKKRCKVTSVPMRFIFSGKCFQAYLPVNRWKRVTVALNDKLSAPSWSFLRIVQPERILVDQVNSVSYEINKVGVMAERSKN